MKVVERCCTISVLCVQVHVFSALVVQAITSAHVTDDHTPGAYWRKIQVTILGEG